MTRWAEAVALQQVWAGCQDPAAEMQRGCSAVWASQLPDAAPA